MLITRLLCVLCAFFGIVSNSHAVTVTIDFEMLASTTDTYVLAGPVYKEKTFSISNLSSSLADALASAGSGNTDEYPGSAALFNNVPDGITELKKTSGDTFDLLSIDLTESTTTAASSTITFTGNVFGGGTVTEPIDLDGTFGFETLTFTGFTNLTSVTWVNTFDYHSFDNIVLDTSSVPVPAAAWLFGSGLVGLLGVARRKKA